jgi:hypothetical protein
MTLVPTTLKLVSVRVDSVGSELTLTFLWHLSGAVAKKNPSHAVVNQQHNSLLFYVLAG